MNDKKFNKELGIVFFIYGFFMYSSTYYLYILLITLGIIFYKTSDISNKKITFDYDKAIAYCLSISVSIGLTVIGINMIEVAIIELTTPGKVNFSSINLLIGLIVILGVIFMDDSNLNPRLINFNLSVLIRNMFFGAVVFNLYKIESASLEILYEYIGTGFKYIYILLFSLIMIYKVTIYLLLLIKMEKQKDTLVM